MKCLSVTNPSDRSLQPILHVFEAWRNAVRRGDPDALADLVTQDAEFWTHLQPALRGRQAVRNAFVPVFEQWALDQSFECDELIVIGGWAFARGTEINRLAPRTGGEVVVRRQRAFSVLEEGQDGVWRFARGMTNAPPEH